MSLTGPVMTLADFEVHVPIRSSCVVADAVLLRNAAVLRSNVLRPTIANVCPSSSVQRVSSSYARSSWSIEQNPEDSTGMKLISQSKDYIMSEMPEELTVDFPSMYG